MATSLPDWLIVLQGALTPVIAIFGAYIAWQQWRTAKSKVVADLFDRRLALYSEFEECLEELLRHNGITQHALSKMHSIRNRMVFLFGRDVTDHLRVMDQALEELREWTDLNSRGKSPTYADFKSSWRVLQGMSTEVHVAVHRYLRLHHH